MRSVSFITPDQELTIFYTKSILDNKHLHRKSPANTLSDKTFLIDTGSEVNIIKKNILDNNVNRYIKQN